jgi:hypothetical protein
MTDQEFVNWIWNDLFREVSKGLLIYAVLLGAYWLTIG